MANEIINSDDVQGKIIVVRSQQVLLDRDVAVFVRILGLIAEFNDRSDIKK